MITNQEIPKVIHYCWFGGNPLPPLAKRCIDSWKQFLPEYEIKQWDESNFDVNSIPYISEAYQEKKYAFVSDYARFWILYRYGGLYFDTDVEIIKSLDDIIAAGPFMGCEKQGTPIERDKIDSNKKDFIPNIRIAPGLGIGVYPHHKVYAEIIKLYSTLSFYSPDGTLNQKTIVEYTTDLFHRYGLKNSSEIQTVCGINIYPEDYFCPLSPTLVLALTSNSRTIHHYSASWETTAVRLRKKIKRLLGYKLVGRLQPLIITIRKIFRKKSAAQA